MPHRKTQFCQGEYYHIYNRGAKRQPIFRSDENYRFLLRRLKENTTKSSIAVIAYCLMPNHYHFLLRQDDDISISECIQSIFNSYTKAFNKMHGTSGTLFEGRFRSIHIDTDEYFTHLCRYIHRNPIDGKRPLVKNLNDWVYSNYLEWIGIRQGSLVDQHFVQGYFQDAKAYQNFVLSYQPTKRVLEDLKPYCMDVE
ncbi:MAG: transposase [bacterium]|nr:transposase [bacterium]